MGLRDWAKHRGMKQPTQAVFSVSDSYHRGDHFYLTGVLRGEGFAPFASEVKVGLHDRWLHAATRDLPAVADAENPASFTILWDDVPQITAQQQARIVAQNAAAAANGQPGQPVPGMQGLAGLFGAAGSMGGIDGETLFGQAFGSMGAAFTRAGNTTSTVRTTVTVNGVPVSTGGSTGTIPTILLGQGAGVAASAVVLSVHDVPEAQWPAGLRPPAGFASFALDVTGPDGATWPATMVQGFLSPQSRAETAVVGATLPVRFDPADRINVALDLTRRAAQRSTESQGVNLAKPPSTTPDEPLQF